MIDPAGIVVIDDGLLVGVLAGDPHVGLRRASRVVTTSLWHYRLCRAVLGDGSGALSRHFVGLATDARRALLATHEVDVLGLTTLAVDAARHAAVPIGDRVVRLNALGAEAVAVAVTIGAALALDVDNPNLRAVAGAVGVEYHVLGP